MAKHPSGFKIWTVVELIDALKKYPPDAYVWHEGCDCCGAAYGVESMGKAKDDTPEILIKRSN